MTYPRYVPSILVVVAVIHEFIPGGTRLRACRYRNSVVEYTIFLYDHSVLRVYEGYQDLITIEESSRMAYPRHS